MSKQYISNGPSFLSVMEAINVVFALPALSILRFGVGPGNFILGPGGYDRNLDRLDNGHHWLTPVAAAVPPLLIAGWVSIAHPDKHNWMVLFVQITLVMAYFNLGVWFLRRASPRFITAGVPYLLILVYGLYYIIARITVKSNTPQVLDNAPWLKKCMSSFSLIWDTDPPLWVNVIDIVLVSLIGVIFFYLYYTLVGVYFFMTAIALIIRGLRIRAVYRKYAIGTVLHERHDQRYLDLLQPQQREIALQKEPLFDTDLSQI